MHMFKSAVAGVFLLSAPAIAAPLNPGDAIFPTGTTVLDPVHGEPQTIINDNLIPFDIDPTPASPLAGIGGNVQNRVTELASGFLGFGPRIRDTFNTDGGTFVIDGFRLTGYSGFSVDAEYRTDGIGDVGFESISGSVDRDILTIRFDEFLRIDALASGMQQVSLFPSIVTDAEHFDLSGTMRVIGHVLEFDASGAPIDPSASDILSLTLTGIAAPTIATVPLPASALLLLAGFASLRRRV